MWHTQMHTLPHLHSEWFISIFRDCHLSFFNGESFSEICSLCDGSYCWCHIMQMRRDGTGRFYWPASIPVLSGRRVICFLFFMRGWRYCVEMLSPAGVEIERVCATASRCVVCASWRPHAASWYAACPRHFHGFQGDGFDRYLKVTFKRAWLTGRSFVGLVFNETILLLRGGACGDDLPRGQFA